MIRQMRSSLLEFCHRACGWARAAATVCRFVHLLAPRHWVQTPYRYFPIEPHWIAPGMQFLPVRARAGIARRWPLAHVRSANLRDALTGVLWTELLDRSQMRFYFPESKILSERLAG